MFRKCSTIAAALALVALVCAGQSITPAHAQPLAAPDPGSAQDVEAFMDGFVDAQLTTHHIAGATVAVVKNGQVVLVKGYGYADYATFKPVDGQTTLFRPGSVSKLFIWTAVMQQVEQGKLDLSADVNTYLKTFKIPDAFGKPVTMLNLMTHTPGFEDGARDLFVDQESRLQTLEVYLSGHIPARIYPPGKVAAYSNYGATLAAYIVQEVSGVPFDEYVEKNIFSPLGMTHSTFRQPLPDALKTDMSKGYYVNGGQYEPGAFELVNAYPAGALSASAADLAKFMIAQLADGEYNGARILKTETAREMHAQAWTPSPQIEGMAHGFYSTTINGQRIIQHGGDTALFHSELMLIPEQKVGLFVSYNSVTGASAGGELAAAFMDRYYPVTRAAPKPPADFKTRLNAYVGSYGLARLNTTTPEKITGLFQNITVSPGQNDTLLVTSIRSPGSVDQWVEAKPGVLKLVGGDDTMVFLDEANGQYQTTYIASVPMVAALRAPWYATTVFGVSLLAVCLVLFLTGILAAPVGLFGLRVKPPDDEPRKWLRRTARWVGFAFCLLTIVYLVGFGASVASLMLNPGSDFGMLIGLTWLARLGVLVALAMIPLCWFAWRGKYWSLAGRIHYTLLTVAAWAYIGFELVWRLV
jgi:CubicO group peptidase (beta-lactamase class C family)